MGMATKTLKINSIQRWKKLLTAVHAKLCKQTKINEKLSPRKGRGGSVGR